MKSGLEIFAEANRRRKELLEKLEVYPVVDVLGVVDPSGASGSHTPPDNFWYFRCKLSVWRIEGSDVQMKALTIYRKVTKEELGSLQRRFKTYSVMRIKARVASDSAFGDPEALLEDVVGIETADAELNDHARQLQKPVTFKDAILGIFKLDRQINEYESKVIWNKIPVRLSLSADQPRDVQEELKTAHLLWADQNGWNQRICDCATKLLLPLKNETWLENGETKLTSIQFKNRLKLESISIYPNGAFAFWHNDGGLFWGHSIEVSGTVDDGPTHANIAG